MSDVSDLQSNLASLSSELAEGWEFTADLVYIPYICGRVCHRVAKYWTIDDSDGIKRYGLPAADFIETTQLSPLEFPGHFPGFQQITCGNTPFVWCIPERRRPNVVQLEAL